MKRKVISIVAALVAGLTISSIGFAHHQEVCSMEDVQQQMYAGEVACDVEDYRYTMNHYGHFVKDYYFRLIRNVVTEPTSVNMKRIYGSYSRWNPNSFRYEYYQLNCEAYIPPHSEVTVQREICRIASHDLTPYCADGVLQLNPECVLEECPNEMPQPYRDLCRDSSSTYSQCSECIIDGGSSSSSSSSSSGGSGGSSSSGGPPNTSCGAPSEAYCH